MVITSEAYRRRLTILFLGLVCLPASLYSQVEITLKNTFIERFKNRDQVALQVHESCGHPIELDRVLGSEAEAFRLAGYGASVPEPDAPEPPDSRTTRMTARPSAGFPIAMLLASVLGFCGSKSSRPSSIARIEAYLDSRA